MLDGSTFVQPKTRIRSNPSNPFYQIFYEHKNGPEGSWLRNDETTDASTVRHVYTVLLLVACTRKTASSTHQWCPSNACCPNRWEESAVAASAAKGLMSPWGIPHCRSPFDLCVQQQEQKVIARFHCCFAAYMVITDESLIHTMVTSTS